MSGEREPLMQPSRVGEELPSREPIYGHGSSPSKRLHGSCTVGDILSGLEQLRLVDCDRRVLTGDAAIGLAREAEANQPRQHLSRHDELLGVMECSKAKTVGGKNHHQSLLKPKKKSSRRRCNLSPVKRGIIWHTIVSLPKICFAPFA